MASKKQNEANRLNAQRSSGPRSAEGKRRSSLNALKHGLFARIHILPGESEEEFQNLEKGLRDELKPNSIMQDFYFSKIVEVLWRIRRIETVESGLFQNILGSAQYDLLRAMIESDRYRPQVDTSRQFESALGIAPTTPFPSSTSNTQDKVLERMSELSWDQKESAMQLGRQVSLEPGVGLDRLARYERHLMTTLKQLLSAFGTVMNEHCANSSNPFVAGDLTEG